MLASIYSIWKIQVWLFLFFSNLKDDEAKDSTTKENYSRSNSIEKDHFKTFPKNNNNNQKSFQTLFFFSIMTSHHISPNLSLTPWEVISKLICFLFMFLLFFIVQLFILIKLQEQHNLVFQKFLHLPVPFGYFLYFFLYCNIKQIQNQLI